MAASSRRIAETREPAFTPSLSMRLRGVRILAPILRALAPSVNMADAVRPDDSQVALLASTDVTSLSGNPEARRRRGTEAPSHSRCARPATDLPPQPNLCSPPRDPCLSTSVSGPAGGVGADVAEGHWPQAFHDGVARELAPADRAPRPRGSAPRCAAASSSVGCLPAGEARLQEAQLDPVGQAALRPAGARGRRRRAAGSPSPAPAAFFGSSTAPVLKSRMRDVRRRVSTTRS